MSFWLTLLKSSSSPTTRPDAASFTVDAYAAAIPFYLKQKFVPLTVEDEGAETRLLYFDLNDIAD